MIFGEIDLRSEKKYQYQSSQTDWTMPKRGKEPRPSSRHSGGHFSPTPPSRQSRNDYQIAGPSRST